MLEARSAQGACDLLRPRPPAAVTKAPGCDERADGRVERATARLRPGGQIGKEIAEMARRRVGDAQRLSVDGAESAVVTPCAQLASTASISPSILSSVASPRERSVASAVSVARVPIRYACRTTGSRAAASPGPAASAVRASHGIAVAPAVHATHVSSALVQRRRRLTREEGIARGPARRHSAAPSALASQEQVHRIAEDEAGAGSDVYHHERPQPARSATT